MTVVQEVLDAEARLHRALLARDIPTLESLLADDVLSIGPDGGKGDKETDLIFQRSGAVVFGAIGVLDAEVHPVSPDVAVLRTRLALDLLVDGEPFASAFRYLRVYARREGRWQIVYAQADAP